MLLPLIAVSEQLLVVQACVSVLVLVRTWRMSKSFHCPRLPRMRPFWARAPSCLVECFALLRLEIQTLE